jgi:hypothetical protein
VSGKKKAERVGVLRGVASRNDEKLLSGIMEGLGLRVVFQELVIPLRSIDTAEDFLLKEHFEAFREHDWPGLSRTVSARAFNHLVDSRSHDQLAEDSHWDDDLRKRVYMGQPVPYSGIIACERADIGFDPYTTPAQISYNSQELARFAIQAGSLVGARPDIAQAFVSPAQVFVLSMIDQLDEQIAA